MTSCSEERNQINERVAAKTTTTASAMPRRFSFRLEQQGIGHRCVFREREVLVVGRRTSIRCKAIENKSEPIGRCESPERTDTLEACEPIESSDSQDRSLELSFFCSSYLVINRPSSMWPLSPPALLSDCVTSCAIILIEIVSTACAQHTRPLSLRLQYTNGEREGREKHAPSSRK